MYEILSARKAADRIYEMVVRAPRVAQHCEPGQFLIVIVDEKGERIPLTICDYDRKEGTVRIVFQVVGASTLRMSRMQAGDSFHDVVGPLGRPSEFVTDPLDEVKKRRYLFVAGGVGAAPVYPQVRWMKEHGVVCDVIEGARNKNLILLEDELKATADHLYITTDDGSYVRKGLVTNVIQDLYDAGERYDVCVVIGPMIMMKFACLLTQKLGLHTIVSMNTIMVDGTGMCGACRLKVGDETKFACVDGPEFDGHLIDWQLAMERQQLYKTEEGRAYLREQDGDTHKGGCGQCGGED